MGIEGIIAVIVILVVLFLGYYLFLRYSRAKSRILRQPGAVLTKIYQDEAQFEEEAKKMLEGGYTITYISHAGKYTLTEGLTLEQIMAQLKGIRKNGGFFIVSYSK
ncbi:MAG: hypothetical protein NUV68_05065 [Caldiserica bacterium]|jgi:hypothetical protein|nr:hypothetical protein [Caldisericota bacterium]MDH7562699.1 hypothetical protein [Caldisericota bacterium]